MVSKIEGTKKTREARVGFYQIHEDTLGYTMSMRN
jgi:hypothetical protein